MEVHVLQFLIFVRNSTCMCAGNKFVRFTSTALEYYKLVPPITNTLLGEISGLYLFKLPTKLIKHKYNLSNKADPQ
jgi:hypothetical protein